VLYVLCSMLSPCCRTVQDVLLKTGLRPGDLRTWTTLDPAGPPLMLLLLTTKASIVLRLPVQWCVRQLAGESVRVRVRVGE
jgi:hypothetical protein